MWPVTKLKGILWPEKKKNFDPDLIREEIQDRIERDQAKLEQKYEKIVRLLLHRITTGKYKARPEGYIAIDVWGKDTSELKVERLNQLLEPYGIRVTNDYYIGAQAYVEFIRNPDHTLGRDRLQE